MKWNRYTIRTTTAAEDDVLFMLSELGIENVEIIDKQAVLSEEEQVLFEDVMPKVEPDDGNAEVVFYLDESKDDGALVESVLTGLEELKTYCNVGEGVVLKSVTEDQDWANSWKAYFHAFTVGDFLIKPTWVETPEGMKGKYLIEIDPGAAFGTGSHETTKLCLQALDEYLEEDDEVLDIGTGSGILSIAALKLGASFAFGTDIDEMAVASAAENRDRNGFDESEFTVHLGDIITDEALQKEAGFGCYDVVVSNILADVIIELQKEAVLHLKPGGVLIVSGIIDSKEEAVRHALHKNPLLEIVDEDRLGEWVSFVARRRG